MKKRVRRCAAHQTLGEHYNLKEIYDRLNDLYFEGRLDLGITWVGNKHSLPRTRVMFGCYQHEKKLIKIHRRLDQAHVLDHFVSFVVYHEMLHHVLPPIKVRGCKRRIHHLAFVQREREFQEYGLAQAFSKNMKKSWFKQEI